MLKGSCKRKQANERQSGSDQKPKTRKLKKKKKAGQHKIKFKYGKNTTCVCVCMCMYEVQGEINKENKILNPTKKFNIKKTKLKVNRLCHKNVVTCVAYRLYTLLLLFHFYSFTFCRPKHKHYGAELCISVMTKIRCRFYVSLLSARYLTLPLLASRGLQLLMCLNICT